MDIRLNVADLSNAMDLDQTVQPLADRQRAALFHSMGRGVTDLNKLAEAVGATPNQVKDFLDQQNEILKQLTYPTAESDTSPWGDQSKDDLGYSSAYSPHESPQALGQYSPDSSQGSPQASGQRAPDSPDPDYGAFLMDMDSDNKLDREQSPNDLDWGQSHNELNRPDYFDTSTGKSSASAQAQPSSFSNEEENRFPPRGSSQAEQTSLSAYPPKAFLLNPELMHGGSAHDQGHPDQVHPDEQRQATEDSAYESDPESAVFTHRGAKTPEGFTTHGMPEGYAFNETEERVLGPPRHVKKNPEQTEQTVRYARPLALNVNDTAGSRKSRARLIKAVDDQRMNRAEVSGILGKHPQYLSKQNSRTLGEFKVLAPTDQDAGIRDGRKSAARRGDDGKSINPQNASQILAVHKKAVNKNAAKRDKGRDGV